MIDWPKDRPISFTCDNCSDAVLETDAYNLKEAAQELRAAKWSYFEDNDGGDWIHHCPACAQEIGTA